jgi:hypothetical protein
MTGLMILVMQRMDHGKAARVGMKPWYGVGDRRSVCGLRSCDRLNEVGRFGARFVIWFGWLVSWHKWKGI